MSPSTGPSFIPNIAVTSPSFSRHPLLTTELRQHFPLAKFNTDGVKLAGDDLKFFLKDAQGAILGTEPLDRQILQALPELKVISKFGVGTDNLDIAGIQSLQKSLLLFPGTNREAVAELTLGLILSLARQLNLHFQSLAQGQWEKRIGFELQGKTVGLIGLGHIGKRVAELLAPFGVKILANDLLDGQKSQQDFYRRHRIRAVEKEFLFQQADIVSLHLPLTLETKHLINQETLRLMPPHAWLINTARGGLINFIHLRQALEEKIIDGAAIDTFDPEPFDDLQLLAHPRFLATPHIGGSTENAILAMGREAINGLQTFFSQQLESMP